MCLRAKCGQWIMRVDSGTAAGHWIMRVDTGTAAGQWIMRVDSETAAGHCCELRTDSGTFGQDEED
jgi:hypothetical protein